MPDQTIGTVRVQVGTTVNPRVSSINYGGSGTIKGATDVDVRGAADGEVLVYRAATDSFVVAPVSAAVAGLDAGTF
jgi:hypothetical protein